MFLDLQHERFLNTFIISAPSSTVVGISIKSKDERVFNVSTVT
jgi:hypothetical protein